MRCRLLAALGQIVVSPLAAQEAKLAVKVGKDKIDFFSRREEMTRWQLYPWVQ